MNMYRKALVAGALALGYAGSANAVVYDFSYSGSTVATMDVTSAGGSTTFVLDFVWAPSGGAAFIKDVSLIGGTPGGYVGGSAAIGDVIGAPSVAYYPSGGGADGGNYNWVLGFETSNSPAKGPYRFQVGETFSWIINTEFDFDLTVLHINAFLGEDSIKLDGCQQGDRSCVSVPEPATLGLLGLGLLGVGLARRRRRQKA